LRRQPEDSDDSDMSDFIVDHIDEQTGEGVRKKREKKRPSRVSRITENQLEEATSIFGDMGDFLAESRGSYDEVRATCQSPHTSDLQCVVPRRQ
jgi:hypothetical protein